MTQSRSALPRHALLLLGAVALLLGLVPVPSVTPTVGPAKAASNYEAVVDLTFPFASDVSVRYVDDYDFCRSGCARRHQSTDLMVSYGTPIHAVTSGRVVGATGISSRVPSYGYLLRVRGDDGRMYIYLHMGRQDRGPGSAYAPGIREGVRVERGEVIAYAGCSGSASCGAGVHLHLEIHDDDVRDPYGYHSEERMNPFPSLRAAERQGDYPDTQGPFGDVPGTAVFAEVIARAADEGLTAGCDDDRFCPGANVTRAQTASFVTRMLDARHDGDWAAELVSASTGPVPDFTDVPDDGVHAGAITDLAEAGVAEPCADERYCPKRGATRAELAGFLARALALPAAQPDFADVAADAPFAAEIAALAAAGISQGCGDGSRFCPDERVTRAQFAALLVASLDHRPLQPACADDCVSPAAAGSSRP